MKMNRFRCKTCFVFVVLPTVVAVALTLPPSATVRMAASSSSLDVSFITAPAAPAAIARATSAEVPNVVRTSMCASDRSA